MLLDHDKLAYYDISWGAVMGVIVPAMEPRIKVGILELIKEILNWLDQYLGPVN